MTPPPTVPVMAPAERGARAGGFPAIWISVLGRCEIHLARARVKPESAVFFGLLLYLGLRPGVRVTREELLELFWPGSPEQARRHSLRQLLYRIRRAEVPLELDGAEVVLDAVHVRSDVEELFADGWADRVGVEDVPHPRELFAGYRHPLGAAFSAWVDGIRDDACVEIRRACARHIAEGRREGRWSHVERVARICIASDPLNEGAHLALAEATVMTATKSEALRILDAFLFEVEDNRTPVGRDARILRNRIAARPEFHFRRPGEPPLVGRADEVRWLNHRRDTAVTGVPVAAQLVGEPGIGKTAVVRAFLSSADMCGWRATVARMQPHDMDRSLSLFVELVPRLLAAKGAIGASPESIAQLRRLIEHHDEDDEVLAGLSLEAEAVQVRIRDSLRDLIAALAHEAPLIVVLEDLHWVDLSSLTLLASLIGDLDGIPLLWLITTRQESRFGRIRQMFPPDRVPTLVLAPLSEADTRSLFTAVAPQLEGNSGAARIAFAATGGNPLFIREVAAHIAASRDAAQLPRTLRALMAERVSRLEPASRRVLNTCAVLGRFASARRVADVLEMRTTELTAAVEDLGSVGLIGLTEESGSFGLHDLWQEHLLGSMSASIKSFLHLRVGQVLKDEANHAQSSVLAISAARHLALGGSPEAALRLLEDAVRRHLQVGLYEDAVACSESALAVAPDDRTRLNFSQLRLEALQCLGRWHAILESVDNVQSLARACGQSGGRHSPLELLAIQSDMLHEQRLEATLASLSECVASVSADVRHRADAARLAARAASNAFRGDVLASLMTVVDRLDQDDLHVHAQSLAVKMIYHADLGDIETACELASNLVGVERSQRSLTGLCHALRNQTVPFRIMGHFDAAEGCALEAHRMAVAHRIPHEVASSADIISCIMFERGHLAEASRWLLEAEPHVNRIGGGHTQQSINHMRAMIALEESKLDAAATIISGLDWRRHRQLNRMALIELGIAVRLATFRGDRTEASNLCDALLGTLRSVCRFRRLGYAVTTLGICVEFLESETAAKHAVSEFRQTDDTSVAPWRELSSRWN